MKRLRSRWTLIAATLVSVALISFVATKRSPSIDGLAFTDADEVKSTLTAKDLETQDSLFAEITDAGQFYEMTANDLSPFFAVANAVWYKDKKVIGYSIDRRGRDGYGANAKSPILLAAEGDTVMFAGCLGPQN